MTNELKEIMERLSTIETRSAEIVEKVATAEGEELRNLGEETKALASEKAELLSKKADLEEREKVAEEIRQGTQKAEKVETPRETQRGKKMTVTELRNTEKYINAYAKYIKTGDASECRAMVAEVEEQRDAASTSAVLTTNATVKGGNASLPVPSIVDETIRTAWDKNDLLTHVKKTSIKGNLQIGFEFSATGADFHGEGETANAEEKLEIGVVTLTPKTVMKWVRVSGEVLDLQGEAFLSYIYAEVAERIAKKIADTVIETIKNSPAKSTKTAPAVETVDASGIGDFINAISKLSDEATNPIIVMNKQSYAYYKGLAIAANYSVDPFDGLQVVFNNTLDVADGKTAGTYAIVGDFGYGAQANYTNGEEVSFKFDDISEAEADLVKVIGRTPVGIGVVAEKAFCKVVKAAA